MAKSDLAHRLQMRQNELDVIMQKLERAGNIKLAEIKGKLVVRLRNSRQLTTVLASSSPSTALYP
jgi:hypothetical protein